MANPWRRKVKPKPSLKGLAATNGEALVKPSLASLAKGKPKVKLGAALGIKLPDPERPYQEPKPRVEEDFRSGGILYSGAEVMGEVTKGYRDGMSRAYGSVDVTNGDQTYTFHNRHGSWMHDVWLGGGIMAEPARVAYWLGIDVSQMDMSRALTRRFEAELKKQGIPTVHQQHVKLEEAAKASRKHTPKPPETTPMTTTPKFSLKGLKK